MCCYEALALRSVCPAVGGLCRRDGCARQRNAHCCTHPRRCGDRGNGRGRGDARTHLREALETFQRLGAAPWAERAEAELRATGETARRRDPSTLSQLTPQELQIVRLVSEGGTNREIGAQLFLSRRTIDYHLRNVFVKLGVSSRAELIRLQLADR